MCNVSAALPLPRWRIPVAAALLIVIVLATQVAAYELAYSTLVWNGDPNTIRQSTIREIQDIGTGDTQILNLGNDTTYPFFSSNGQWLYFQSNYTGAYQVYRAFPDGSNVTDLTPLNLFGSQYKNAMGYSISGDGSKLTYFVNDGSESKAIVANGDGSNAQFVAPQLGFTYMSNLNYSGSQVVFSGPAENYELLTASLPNGQPTILTPGLPQSYVPHFTPDGSTVVFTRIDGNVYSVNLASQQVSQLTQNNNYVELYWNATDQHGSSDTPSISPDGKQIAYIGRVNGVAQVFTMNIDGTHQTQLTFGATDSGRVVWSPDEKQIAFVTFVNNYPQLFVMNATGGAPHQLTNVPGGGVYWVQWVPTAIPGDLNNDGHVDLTDYGILISHWLQTGVSPANGDLSGDGTVNLTDFAVFKNDYLSANGGSFDLAPAVPEPDSLIMAIGIPLVFLFAHLKRQRKRSLMKQTAVQWKLTKEAF